MSASIWKPDPYARHEWRYYDGRGWTSRVADAGKQSDDAVARGPRTRSWLLLVLTGYLWIVVAYAASVSEDKRFLAENKVTTSQVNMLVTIFVVAAALLTWITVRNFRSARIPPAPVVAPGPDQVVVHPEPLNTPAPPPRDAQTSGFLGFVNRWETPLGWIIALVPTVIGLVTASSG